jgi:hypothetical protein
MKKKKKQKELKFPKQLTREDLFKCPIWFADEPCFVNDLNKASDKYIKESQKNLKKDIDKRNKEFGDKGDMGNVFHSTTLIGDPAFKDLQNYIGATAHNYGCKSLLKKVVDITLYTHIGMVTYLDFIF